MQELLMPPNSFSSSDEMKQLPVINNMYKRLLDRIDENVDIWIIGNGDKDFWDTNINTPHHLNKILNPVDLFPMNPKREIKHIGMITHKNNEDISILFGNNDDILSVFVLSVINRAIRMFPKVKIH